MKIKFGIKLNVPLIAPGSAGSPNPGTRISRMMVVMRSGNRSMLTQTRLRYR